MRFIYFLISILLFSATGCDAIYRMLHKEGAEEKRIVGEIIPFESNPVIEEVQSLLKLYGYSVGSVDGHLGVRTRNMVERFQKDRGLPPSRFIDDATWEALHMFSGSGLVEDAKLNLFKVQEILKAQGFDVGPIDGMSGRKTENAVREFQKSRGLVSDGKIGFQTLKHLDAVSR